MNKRRQILTLAATLMISAAAVSANAERVLRLDESAAGELDPAKASDYADSILMFNVYDALIMPAQGEAGYKPLLAKDWEASGNEFTFHLRDDVKFHSGNPMTARDVAFSFDRMKAIGQGLSYLFVDKVQSTEVLDDYTIKFTLTEPFAPFLAAMVRFPIVDSQLISENLGEGDGEMGDWGQAYLSAHDAGTGAYMISSHNPQEESVMVKSPDYFEHMDEAAPDRVSLKYSMEPATVRTMISRGEHDIASQWLPPEVARAIIDDGGKALSEPSAGGFYMKLNTQRAPLDDIHCRRALVHAIDYDTMLQMIAISPDVVAGSPATGILSKNMLGAGGHPTMHRDMEAAKAELAQCQYDVSTTPIEIAWIAEVPLEERFALLAQSNFSELGFKSEIVRMPWTLFTEAVTDPQKTPHVNQLFNTSTTGDPDPLLFGSYASSSAGTWSASEHVNDPKVDELLEASRTELDQAKRAQIFADLETYLLEQAYTIYAYDRRTVFAASDRVTAPAFEDDANAFSVDGYGFAFRFMQVADQ